MMNSPLAPSDLSGQALATSAAPDNAQLDNQYWARWTWAVVGIGVAVRLLRYLLRFPLWGDEYMLAENFLTRDFAGLLRPLEHCQVAPPGYLWLEMAVIRLWGFHEWSLRFVAVASGIGALFLWRWMVVRILPARAALLAVAILAIAYYPIRHAAEVKPYASDLFAATLLVALAVRWQTAPGERKWLWLLAAFAPLMVVLSFPVVFVAGGVGLGLAWTATGQRSWRTWLPVVAYGMTVVIAFLLVYWLSTSGQEQVQGAPMREYWRESFPPSIRQPLAWLGWMLETHTGEMFAYPIGADNFGSIGTALVCAVGAIQLTRQRQWGLLLICGGTFAAAYLAAMLQRYPYGNTSRMVQYLAPLICLLAGFGAATILTWTKSHQHRLLHSVVGAVVALGALMVVRDVVHPYKFRGDWEHQAFARWFWNQDPGDAPLFCAQADLGHDLYPKQDRSGYLCYQHLATERLQRENLLAPRQELPTHEALRCVVFSLEGLSQNPAYQAWYEQMLTTHELADREAYRVLLHREKPRDLYGVYEVYRFTPRDGYRPTTPDAGLRSASRPAR